jgi:hypothetical protein
MEINHSLYYENFIGQDLISVIINGFDYTRLFKNLYGIGKNWRCRLYRFNEFFNKTVLGEKIIYKFSDYYLSFYIEDMNDYVNPEDCMSKINLNNNIKDDYIDFISFTESL